MSALYFEDLAPGMRFVSAGVTLSEAQILDFAFQYDPQPFHIDIKAAAEGPFGGLIASGFQTLAVSFRMIYQTGWFAGTGLGAFGIDQLRWPRPVRPGDTLTVTAEITAARRSASRPDRGLVSVRYVTVNQDGETVLDFTASQIIQARDPGQPA